MHGTSTAFRGGFLEDQSLGIRLIAHIDVPVIFSQKMAVHGRMEPTR